MADELTITKVGDWPLAIAAANPPDTFTFADDGVHISRLSRSRKPRLRAVPRQDRHSVLTRLGSQPEKFTLEGRILTEPFRAAHRATRTSTINDRGLFYPLSLMYQHGLRVNITSFISWDEFDNGAEYEFEAFDVNWELMSTGAPLIADWRIVFARAG